MAMGVVTSLAWLLGFLQKLLQLGSAQLAHQLEELYELFVTIVLRLSGPIPKHLGIIMDGNRRFAKLAGKPRAYGHEKGYFKLADVIRWCSKVGIPHLSVYAFSIDNFRRSEEEVRQLMKMVEDKYNVMVQADGVVRKYNVLPHVHGRVDLAPQGARQASQRLEEYADTVRSQSCVLNIMFAYT